MEKQATLGATVPNLLDEVPFVAFNVERADT